MIFMDSVNGKKKSCVTLDQQKKTQSTHCDGIGQQLYQCGELYITISVRTVT